MHELVQRLVRKGTLVTPRIIRAFEEVDRRDFVGEWNLPDAYEDSALPIGLQQTISQPSTVAFMLELLSPKEGERILDVGTGSCWSTALLAHSVGSRGHIYGVERIEEILAFGANNIAKYAFENVTLRHASHHYGIPEEAPFDKILVSASARNLPEELVAQLRSGGVMVIPIRDSIWRVIKKSRGDTTIEKFDGFIFVPLVRD